MTVFVSPCIVVTAHAAQFDTFVACTRCNHWMQLTVVWLVYRCCLAPGTGATPIDPNNNIRADNVNMRSPLWGLMGSTSPFTPSGIPVAPVCAPAVPVAASGGPGFWSGAATGGALGYLMGRRAGAAEVAAAPPVVRERVIVERPYSSAQSELRRRADEREPTEQHGYGGTKRR